MGLTIRKATTADSAAWLDLLKQDLGPDYISKQVYDIAWVQKQMNADSGDETWLVDIGGKLRSSITLLGPPAPVDQPMANLGRFLAPPEAYRDGSAQALIEKVNQLSDARRQMAVLRVPVSDLSQQTLLEKLGYVCIGFQPCKHQSEIREGILFYLRVGAADINLKRLPLFQSLPQINELARTAFANLKLPTPDLVRDGAAGYPLQTELEITECTAERFEQAGAQIRTKAHAVEISGLFNRGLGMLRVVGETPVHGLLGSREGKVVASVAYYVDEHDRCVRLIDSFSSDELSLGALFQRVSRLAREQINAVYVEVDFLMTAPRVLKTAEQLGFVPVAFLPCAYTAGGQCADVVKMVKLNAVYTLDNSKLTPHAREIVTIVDRNFVDQKVGVAVINLLRSLSVFEGLGDGELGKIARLFTQKLYRPNEKLFSKGDSGNEAFIVLRGNIEIRLEQDSPPVASFGNGAIIGEQAFLQGSPRNAFGVAAQPSIVLVVQRSAFNALVQSEPHLGMVIMRNIAAELSNKLRKANVAITSK